MTFASNPVMAYVTYNVMVNGQATASLLVLAILYVDATRRIQSSLIGYRSSVSHRLKTVPNGSCM